MSSNNKPQNSEATDKQGSNTEKKIKGAQKISTILTNPIMSGGPISTRTSANKLYSAGSTRGHLAKQANVGFQEIMRLVNDAFLIKNDLAQLFYSLNSILVNKLQVNFTAMGLYNKHSNCVNIKLIDKIGSTYTTKTIMTDENNPVVKAVKTKKTVTTQDTGFLSSWYQTHSSTAIIPMMAIDECVGVYIVGNYHISATIEFCQLIANTLGLFAQTKNLLELVETNSDTDSLTGLANHKHLQEELHRQIQSCEHSGNVLSVLIVDVANISRINRDLGHARGDEVIKTVAQKIKQNIRNTDFAGRYGGDEIAVIMPNTSSDEAKYIAEYLSYVISCVYIDDVGPIKVSMGISTYPKSSESQEKLLVLAEQAMYISKGKSQESGNCKVITSEDYNFWDDEALKCFAEVLTKKHAQIGVQFEDELINKFHNEQIISNSHLLDVVTSLANTIDAKDTYTKGHSTFVSRYSEALARAIGLPEAEVERIRLGALLHDIGKIGIPENVLRKPTMLTDEEWEIMKQHPVIGAEKVLAPNESLRDLIPMVKYHHEHWDGSGYPYGLKGEEIPLSARIVAIADAYHALVSDRPYRKGLGVEKACEILKLGANVQWDKELVRQFVIIAPSLSTSV
ncbi:TPA: diguanylate cyclase [Candidatus Galligastranaerophilus gallistercoris]|nr:diguanylate cyclase [Candidatus Galligastranaerophilus gallistercoris]